MTSGEVIAAIRQVFPGARVMTLDAHYDPPDSARLDRIIHWRPWWKLWIRPSYETDSFDCDDYALRSFEIKWNYKKGNLPFGFVIGSKFRGVSGFHAVNMVVCTDGPWLYDAQPDEWWKADPEGDVISFVLI
ncbi:MAG: hypothetical protein ACOY58_05625 [Candidatus Micrarchaeota archaeon]